MKLSWKCDLTIDILTNLVIQYSDLLYRSWYSHIEVSTNVYLARHIFMCQLQQKVRLNLTTNISTRYAVYIDARIIVQGLYKSLLWYIAICMRELGTKENWKSQEFNLVEYNSSAIKESFSSYVIEANDPNTMEKEEVNWTQDLLIFSQTLLPSQQPDWLKLMNRVS